MNDERQALLQNLPKVDLVLNDERIQPCLQTYPRELVLQIIRDDLENLRSSIIADEATEASLDLDEIVTHIVSRVETELPMGIRRAINGMGIILHTGLGRAPIAQKAQEALMEAVSHYCTLQIDQETGRRGDRYASIEKLLIKITGAEAGLVVNNNAAATLLILNTLAGNREVVVSRGELVEIGGSFRIPDVMQRSSAKLVEVGTTNRTHLKDYMNAITADTGLILKVHQSNYRISGFTKQIPIQDLVPLAKAHNLLTVDDLGSGALVDLSRWGLPKEPTAQDSIRAGADVVCFSGDKLLGGSQCGIIIGKKGPIEKIKKNQLTRALRCGKTTMVVLEATLRLFLDEHTLLQSHPVLGMLTLSKAEIKKRCFSLKRKLRDIIGEKGHMMVEEDVSEVGSGSLAAEVLPTWVLSITLQDYFPEKLAQKMRLSNPPIFGRIKEDKFLLDCRTIRRDEFNWIAEAFRKILEEPVAGSIQKAEKPEAEKDIADTISGEVRELDLNVNDEISHSSKQ